MHSTAAEPQLSAQWSPDRPSPAGGRQRHARRRRESLNVTATLPAALVLALFFVAPAVWAIGTSLTDRTLSQSETHWIWFGNYRDLWNTPDFPKFVRNSVAFVVGAALIGQTGLGLALALLIDHATRHGYRLAGLAYAAVLVAWICPPALAGAIWGRIFAYGFYGLPDGPLNTILSALGLPRVDMLTNHAMLAVVIAESWRGVAFAMIIFLGSLQTIPRSIYEAARVDGAGVWRQLVDLTLPSMRHALALVLLMTTIVAMGSFLIIQVFNNGGTSYETETLALHAYHTAFEPFRIGFGASIAVVMLVVNLVFATIYLRLARVRE